MKTPEAAIFDIGNVLLFFDYMKAARRLAAKNQLTRLPDREVITAVNVRLELGEIGIPEFIEVVRKEFRDSGPEEDFLEIWGDIFEENPRMTGLARRLAERMPVFLLSNIGPIHHKFVFERYDVFQIFRDGVFSYRARLMKPAPEIFRLAASQFGVDPETTLYFDDLAENCAAAAGVGFQAHHFEPHREDLPGAWKIPL